MKKTFFKIMLICLPFLLGGIVVSCQDDLSDSVKLEEQKALKAEVEKAKKVTKENTICLLSPAASSYGYFKTDISRPTCYHGYA